MRRTRHGRITATYADMHAARAAIETLERSGIESLHIELGGPAVTDAQDRSEHPREEGSGRAAGFVGRRVLAGGALGSIVGGVLGVVAAVLAGTEPGLVVVAGIAGALALGAVGAYGAGVLSLPLTTDWGLTFEPAEREGVSVGVAAQDPGVLERAATILEETQPRSLAKRPGSRRRHAA